jgi:hypothetical protein
MPVILATQEADHQEDLGSRPAGTKSETLSQKEPTHTHTHTHTHTERADGVAQVVKTVCMTSMTQYYQNQKHTHTKPCIYGHENLNFI